MKYIYVSLENRTFELQYIATENGGNLYKRVKKIMQYGGGREVLRESRDNEATLLKI